MSTETARDRDWAHIQELIVALQQQVTELEGKAALADAMIGHFKPYRVIPEYLHEKSYWQCGDCPCSAPIEAEIQHQANCCWARYDALTSTLEGKAALADAYREYRDAQAAMRPLETVAIASYKNGPDEWMVDMTHAREAFNAARERLEAAYDALTSPSTIAQEKQR